MFVKTSITGHSLHHLLPPYLSSNLRERGHSFHSTCLNMTQSCLKSLLSCALCTNLSHLTTNLFLYVLFCVLSVCYDVRLSHLSKDYLLTYLRTYLLTYLLTYVIIRTHIQNSKCILNWQLRAKYDSYKNSITVSHSICKEQMNF